MESRTVEETALNNPIILSEILKQSSVPLKSCRLVSHFWNDMVLSLPNRKLSLKLNHKDYAPVNEPIPFFALLFTIDPRLAKRIYATCFHTLTETHFAAKLIHVGDKFSERIQILEVSIDYESCLKGVYQVLKNCCQNLQQLRINCTLAMELNYVVDAGAWAKSLALAPLKPKPSLTAFTLSAMVPSPLLRAIIQAVVDAAPNLREVTTTFGFCPDFANSKQLDSLTLALDGVEPKLLAEAGVKLLKTSRILAQVADQLETLKFAHMQKSGQKKQLVENYNFEAEHPTQFRLPGRMRKLKYFRNEMVDVFKMGDFFENMSSIAPSLKSVAIGKVCKPSKRVDKILQSVSEQGQIFASVSNLVLIEAYEPALLEGLGTAFPNLERLEVDSYFEDDWKTASETMDLGVILRSLSAGGWGQGLKYLKLAVPSYPNDIVEFIKILLDSKELFGYLKTFELKTYKVNYARHVLLGSEMKLFKKLLLAMDGMDRVTIWHLYLCKISKDAMLEFLKSNKMSESKFKFPQN